MYVYVYIYIYIYRERERDRERETERERERQRERERERERKILYVVAALKTAANCLRSWFSHSRKQQPSVVCAWKAKPTMFFPLARKRNSKELNISVPRSPRPDTSKISDTQRRLREDSLKSTDSRSGFARSGLAFALTRHVQCFCLKASQIHQVDSGSVAWGNLISARACSAFVRNLM